MTRVSHTADEHLSVDESERWDAREPTVAEGCSSKAQVSRAITENLAEGNRYSLNCNGE